MILGSSRWSQAAYIVFALGAIPGVLHAQNPAEASSSTSQAIRLDLSGTPPLTPTGNTIRSYTIDSADDFVPGQLADSYFGDMVLQNDAIKVVIAGPDKHAAGNITPGSIIDVSRQSRPLDYINSIQTIPDIETTASQVQYTYADKPAVDQNTTAVVVLHGTASVGDEVSPEPAIVDVTTTFSLGKNSNVVSVVSDFRNPSTTTTAALLPGDVVDWGEAAGFVEGVGVPISPSLAPAAFALGYASDYSVGIVTSGTEPIKGLHTTRDSVIPAYSPNTSSALSGRGKSPRTPSQHSTEANIGDLPAMNKSPLQLVQERIARGEIKLPTETQYGQNSDLTALGYSTETLEMLARISSSTLTGKAEASAADQYNTSTRKLLLPPGQSFAYSRFVVVSDSDFSRISNFAFDEKRTPTGQIAGAVIDSVSNARIADADVYVSGGPKWSGTVTAPAYFKVRTRSDGTFSARVPAGKYILSAGKIGRLSASDQSIIEVVAGARPKIVALALSPESLVRIAVSEAETPTSSPLPVKLTFVAKQGTMQPNWGDGPRGDRGIRNTWFLPYGAANIPITPGKYVVYVSRGMEYDTVRQDIAITPGSQEIVRLSLPHTMHGMLPGLISMDAGLITTASASGAASIEDRVIQAACEGVHIIVSGDYNRATDLQPTIDKLGMGRWVKAMMGMRLLLHKGTESAEVLAYPLTHDQATSLTRFQSQVTDMPPDLALSDLRRAFPGVLLEIAKPTDPERGYLTHLGFDSMGRRFTDPNVPPPDFDSIQVFEGKKLGLEQTNYPRYSDLQVIRSNDTAAKVSPLSPTAYSGSSLPFGQEIGYPRLYMYTDKKDKSELSEADVIQKIRGQHYIVTNGPILALNVENPSNGSYDMKPGDVVDLSSTRVLRLQMRVLAANWVSFNGLALHEAGIIQLSTPSIRQVKATIRYPVLDHPDINTRYIDHDQIIDGIAYGESRSLAPIVSDALPDFGGPIHPYAFTGPMFIDKENDGQIHLQAPDLHPKPRPRLPSPEEEAAAAAANGTN